LLPSFAPGPDSADVALLALPSRMASRAPPGCDDGTLVAAPAALGAREYHDERVLQPGYYCITYICM